MSSNVSYIVDVISVATCGTFTKCKRDRQSFFLNVDIIRIQTRMADKVLRIFLKICSLENNKSENVYHNIMFTIDDDYSEIVSKTHPFKARLNCTLIVR